MTSTSVCCTRWSRRWRTGCERAHTAHPPYRCSHHTSDNSPPDKVPLLPLLYIYPHLIYFFVPPFRASTNGSSYICIYAPWKKWWLGCSLTSFTLKGYNLNTPSYCNVPGGTEVNWTGWGWTECGTRSLRLNFILLFHLGSLRITFKFLLKHVLPLHSFRIAMEIF